MEVFSIPDTEVQTHIDNNKQQRKSSSGEKPEEFDLAIKMNKWGFAFIFLFCALLAYIAISGFTGIFPFERPDPLAQAVNLRSSLGLVILLVGDLILLALGIYFGWMRTTPESEEQTQKTTEEEQPTEVIFTDVETEDSVTEDEEKEE